MLNKIHRISGMVIFVFLLAHIYNHLQALYGASQHVSVMHALRPWYQSAILETILLAAVCIQIATGIFFITRRLGERQGFFQHAQALSGLVLALYLLIHVAGVTNSRVMDNVDTNFYYIAALISNQPYLYTLFFATGLMAMFIHLACGLRWAFGGVASTRVRNWLAAGVIFNGFVMTVLILLAFSGVFYPIEVPTLR